MSIFGSYDLPEPELSDERIGEVLVEIRRNARNRRLALIAPVALAAAVIGAIVAAPHRYGGLALVPDAEASSTLPRVFGANGVWRLPQPIGDAPAGATGPGAVVELPAEPASPTYVLVPPAEDDAKSLPVSASTPPTPTPGQSPKLVGDEFLHDAGELAPEELDWSLFRPIVVVAAETPEPEEIPEPEETAAPDESAAPDETTSSTPEGSTSAIDAGVGETTTPQLSSTDEDVSVAETQPIVRAGDVAETAISSTGDLEEANPSTPPADPADEEMQPASRVATIIPRTPLVHSAHVSVTVQVVDDDSSVIDWCNTRVDWGDGSVTWMTDVDGVAPCTASCEYEASSSTLGINSEIVFTHDYQSPINVSPHIYVATGDGCNYTLAELRLNQFAVVPY